ncbi:MAG: alanine racemase [Ruminococcus sp.]|nr:alanine racemase [Ruminococcus sp.]
MPDSYVKIDLAALEHNARILTTKYSEYKHFIGVVKGDAYGHGYEAVNALQKGGVDYFAVSSLEEAKALREHNKEVSVLCLQPVSLDRLDEAKALELTLAIGDTDYLKRFIILTKNNKFKVHQQIDTGFNRLGFKDQKEIKEAYDTLTQNGHTVEGIYQHFATAGVFDPHFDEQAKRFVELTSLLDLSSIPMVHMGSGVALLGHGKFPFANTTRMGLVMYGYNIAPTSYGGGMKNKLREYRDGYYRRKYRLSPVNKDVALDLIPAMTFKTRVIQTKTVKAGEYIGYDCAYQAKEDMKIAVLPVGYNNGIGRQDFGRVVEIGEKLFPVVGEIGMNMLCVKVDDSIKTDDEVTLLGGEITLGMFSRSSGLGLAEALVGIGKNNVRIHNS